MITFSIRTALLTVAGTGLFCLAAYAARRTFIEARKTNRTLAQLNDRIGTDYWRVYDHVQRDLLLHSEESQ